MLDKLIMWLYHTNPSERKTIERVVGKRISVLNLMLRSGAKLKTDTAVKMEQAIAEVQASRAEDDHRNADIDRRELCDTCATCPFSNKK